MCCCQVDLGDRNLPDLLGARHESAERHGGGAINGGVGDALAASLGDHCRDHRVRDAVERLMLAEIRLQPAQEPEIAVGVGEVLSDLLPVARGGDLEGHRTVGGELGCLIGLLLRVSLELLYDALRLAPVAGARRA